jgi:anthranilate synthase component 2
MNPKLLLIDNYDSFTYNIYQALIDLGAQCDVVKNDEIPMATIHSYHGIIISPGPGLPEESGDLLKFLKQLPATMPVLGICLGMQAIAQHFKGKLKQLTQVVHGVQTTLSNVSKSSLFKELNLPILVGRYHSWVVDETAPGEAMRITATDDSGYPMVIEHEIQPIYGVQFHPESILTPEGNKLLANFLAILREDQIPELPTSHAGKFTIPTINGLYC